MATVTSRIQKNQRVSYPPEYDDPGLKLDGRSRAAKGSVKYTKPTTGITMSGKPRKQRVIANPFGTYGMRADGTFPDPFDLDFDVQRRALETYVQATEFLGEKRPKAQQMLEAAEIVNTRQKYLRALLSSKNELVRYKGIRQVAEQLYLKNKLVFHKQHFSTQLRKRIGQMLNKELYIKGNWQITPAVMLLGAVGCTVTGNKSSDRPELPLVGMLILLKYSDVLISGMITGASDKELEDLAMSKYFK